MIQVTFNFSDIAAAASLFAKLNGTELSAVVSAPTEVKSSPKPKAEKTAATPAASAVASPAPSQPTAEAAQSTSAPSPAASETPTTSTAQAAAAPSAVDYPTLQKAVIALHKLDPSAAVPIAKSLGADTFKLLKPEQWAEAHALVVAKTAELQVA